MSRNLKLVAVCATFAILAAFSGVAEARHCGRQQRVRCCKAPRIRCCNQQNNCQATTACATNACQTVASTCCSQPAATCFASAPRRCTARVSCCSAPSNCAPACGAGAAIHPEVRDVPAPPTEEAAPAPKA